MAISSWALTRVAAQLLHDRGELAGGLDEALVQALLLAAEAHIGVEGRGELPDGRDRARGEPLGQAREDRDLRVELVHVLGLVAHDEVLLLAPDLEQGDQDILVGLVLERLLQGPAGGHQAAEEPVHLVQADGLLVAGHLLEGAYVFVQETLAPGADRCQLRRQGRHVGKQPADGCDLGLDLLDARGVALEEEVLLRDAHGQDLAGALPGQAVEGLQARGQALAHGVGREDAGKGQDGHREDEIQHPSDAHVAPLCRGVAPQLRLGFRSARLPAGCAAAHGSPAAPVQLDSTCASMMAYLHHKSPPMFRLAAAYSRIAECTQQGRCTRVAGMAYVIY